MHEFMYMIVFTGGMGSEIVDWSIYINKEDADEVKEEKYKGYDCYVASIPVVVL